MSAYVVHPRANATKHLCLKSFKCYHLQITRQMFNDKLKPTKTEMKLHGDRNMFTNATP